MKMSEDSGPLDRGSAPARPVALGGSFDVPGVAQSVDPVEPVEDSPDDPVPDNPLGIEADAELDVAELRERALAAEPTASARAARERRLSHPSVTARLMRRFCRTLPDMDLLEDLVQHTLRRAVVAPSFPSDDRPIFPWIYGQGAPRRRKVMRAYLRSLELDMPLALADVYGQGDTPVPEQTSLDGVVVAPVADEQVPASQPARAGQPIVATARMKPRPPPVDVLPPRPGSRATSPVWVYGLAAASVLGLASLLVYHAHGPIASARSQTSQAEDVLAAPTDAKASLVATCARSSSDVCLRAISAAEAIHPTLAADPDVARAFDAATKAPTAQAADRAHRPSEPQELKAPVQGAPPR
jgi:hypothetical protein